MTKEQIHQELEAMGAFKPNASNILYKKDEEGKIHVLFEDKEWVYVPHQ